MAHTETDAWLALSLASYLNLLPLSRQLSCLSGSLWSRTLQARTDSPHLHTNQDVLPVRLAANMPTTAVHGASPMICDFLQSCPTLTGSL